MQSWDISTVLLLSFHPSGIVCSISRLLYKYSSLLYSLTQLLLCDCPSFPPTIGWPNRKSGLTQPFYPDHWLTNRKSDHSSPFLLRPLVDQQEVWSLITILTPTIGWPTGSLFPHHHSYPDHWLTNRKSGHSSPFLPRPLVDKQEVWSLITILTPTIGWPTGSLVTQPFLLDLFHC